MVISQKDRTFLHGEDERGKRKRRKANRKQTSQREIRVLGSLEDGSFSYFLLLRQNWLCVNAAAEGLPRRTEMMERMQQQKYK